MKNIKSATIGELITEFYKLTVKSVKEINSSRGLSKQTGTALDAIIEEFRDRGILTDEQVEEINK